MEKPNKLAHRIIQEIKKSSSTVGRTETDEPKTTELEYDNIELMINGKKTKCDIGIVVEYTVTWYIEDRAYDYPGAVEVKNVDYGIESIGINMEDGTILTEEQEEKILKENRDFLEDYIEEDMYNIAER